MDDLVEAVQDDRVINVILARLSTSINSTIETMFAKLADNFATTFQRTLEKFATDLVTAATSPLASKLVNMEEENKRLSQRVNDLENISRLDNLIVYGLSETPSTPISSSAATVLQSHSNSGYDETARVLDLCCNRLGLQMDRSDISYAHRITRGAKDNHRPILVGFTSRRAKNQVYAAKKTLRPSSSDPNHIYINEHLTKQNAHIYAMTRKLVREKKIHSTWSAGGLIYVRKSTAPEDRPTKVISIGDLDQAYLK